MAPGVASSTRHYWDESVMGEKGPETETSGLTRTKPVFKERQTGSPSSSNEQSILRKSSWHTVEVWFCRNVLAKIKMLGVGWEGGVGDRDGGRFLP